MIIDANNLILGRVGTYAAKKALLGEKVDIVNCESCVVTGDKKSIFERYRKFLQRGIHSKGPHVRKSPDRFVKRAIRGMLPYKKDKGIKAFKSIKCHIGIPEEMKSQKPETLKNANIEKVPNLKYITVKDICKHIGGK
ncbi:MAG TPA: 50S ribosomal protein L13 [Candidatus Woesearchaeota archaeon]|jgi:large subunit ribosomal protein L13|nr:50S ribosomal protein L13 [Candidatus Woesearchaeota archaeon]HJN56542.1 50S ribosomal protein L13 [Candidatus Woesearchaeota archaeon]|tara:strand:+ start:29715 stop:30128 length:414 start_codon:yes stop_codon:yes gene_type:complete